MVLPILVVVWMVAFTVLAISNTDRLDTQSHTRADQLCLIANQNRDLTRSLLTALSTPKPLPTVVDQATAASRAVAQQYWNTIRLELAPQLGDIDCSKI